MKKNRSAKKNMGPHKPYSKRERKAHCHYLNKNCNSPIPHSYPPPPLVHTHSLHPPFHAPLSPRHTLNPPLPPNVPLHSQKHFPNPLTTFHTMTKAQQAPKPTQCINPPRP